MATDTSLSEHDQVILKALEAIHNYLKGSSAAELSSVLDSYNDSSDLMMDFFHMHANNESIRGVIKAIHLELGLSLDDLDTWFNNRKVKTIYEYLIELIRRYKFIQLNHVIKEIERRKSKPFTYKVIIAAIITSSLTMGLLIVTPHLLSLILTLIVHLVVAVCISPIGIPIVCMLYTIALFAYTVFCLYHNQKQELDDRMHEFCFSLIATLLTLVAYVLWLGSHTVMGPLIVLFSLLSAGIDLLKEVFWLVREVRYRYQNPATFIDVGPSADQDLNKIACQINDRIGVREDASKSLHIRIIAIKLISAIILMSIMVVWCFAPSNLLVTGGFIALVLAVYAAKHFILYLNEHFHEHTLQNRLKNAETMYQQLSFNYSADMTHKKQDSNPPNGGSKGDNRRSNGFDANLTSYYLGSIPTL